MNFDICFLFTIFNATSLLFLRFALAPDQMNLPAQMPRPDDGMRGGGEGVMNTIYSDSSSSSNSNSNAESREGTSSGPRLGRGSGQGALVDSLNGSRTMTLDTMSSPQVNGNSSHSGAGSGGGQMLSDNEEFRPLEGERNRMMIMMLFLTSPSLNVILFTTFALYFIPSLSLSLSVFLVSHSY